MMNNTRSTCIAMTLLLVAVSLAYGGYCIVRGTEPLSFAGPRSRDTALEPTAPTGARPFPVSSVTSTVDAFISCTEARLIDAQLEAIQNELESLEMPEDRGNAVISEGLQ